MQIGIAQSIIGWDETFNYLEILASANSGYYPDNTDVQVVSVAFTHSSLAAPLLPLMAGPAR